MVAYRRFVISASGARLTTFVFSALTNAESSQDFRAKNDTSFAN